MSENILTQTYIKECFDYFPETGELIWKKRPIHHFKGDHGMASTNAKHAGNKIELNHSGYNSVMISGSMYQTHRVIWVYVHGEIDSGKTIDHINHIRYDNRLINLRLVVQSENLKNLSLRSSNKSGFNGVWRRTDRKNKQWKAYITVDKKRIHLGYFATIEEAINRREKANIKYNFHNNHGVKK